MSGALDQRLRGGAVSPVVLFAAVLALVVAVLVLWWWFRGLPQSGPVAPVASAPEAPVAGSEPLRGETPEQRPPSERTARAVGGSLAKGAAGRLAGAPGAALEGEIQNRAALAAYRDGVSAQEQGDSEAALQAFLEAVEREPDNAFLLDAAGLAAWKLDRLAEAGTLYARALAAEEQRFGKTHARVASRLSRLAAVYADEGRYGEAEGLYVRALSIFEQTGAPAAGELAELETNLGVLYQRNGRNDEALALFESALEKTPDSSASEDPNKARLVHAIGMVHNEAGRYEEARTYLEEAILLFEEKLGPEHPTLALELINLGRITVAERGFEEAKPYYDRAYTIEGEIVVGPTSRVTNDLVRRAAERNAAGHPEEARSILMFGRERSEEIFGVDHTSTVILENQLALLDRKTAAR